MKVDDGNGPSARLRDSKNIFVVEIAHEQVSIVYRYAATKKFMQNYLSEDKEFSNSDLVEIYPNDIEEERKILDAVDPGCIISRSGQSLEIDAILRKIAGLFLERDVMLFHGSCIVVDGRAYLFAANSGVGKSTHARMWREVLGERAVMLNDDKPFLRIEGDGSVMAYGSPWQGKHNLGCNMSAPLAGLAILSRADDADEASVYAQLDGPELARVGGAGADAGGVAGSSCPPLADQAIGGAAVRPIGGAAARIAAEPFARIHAMAPGDAFPKVYTQGVRSCLPERTAKILPLVDAITRSCPMYHLYATPDHDCARMAIRVMCGGV